MKHRGCVTVSFEALAGLLHLPPGMEIVSVQVHENLETVDFFLFSPGMPAVDRRTEIPRLRLSELIDRELY